MSISHSWKNIRVSKDGGFSGNAYASFMDDFLFCDSIFIAWTQAICCGSERSVWTDFDFVNGDGGIFQKIMEDDLLKPIWLVGCFLGVRLLNHIGKQWTLDLPERGMAVSERGGHMVQLSGSAADRG